MKVAHRCEKEKSRGGGEEREDTERRMANGKKERGRAEGGKREREREMVGAQWPL